MNGKQKVFTDMERKNAMNVTGRKIKDTEKRNPATTHIDRFSTVEMISVMQRENMNAASSVGKAAGEIAKAVDEIAERMKKGGRLFYVGCGTSGRLGVLDASECPPTFGISPDLVVGIIAGGDRALRNAVEGVEDDPSAGEKDLAGYGVSPVDSVVGLSAAGAAPYVLGALRFAKRSGMLTVGVTSNSGTPLSEEPDISIVTETGPEVITGSTRMKAGTAQKLVLNMISTGVMIKLGTVYENMMINLRPMNSKLTERMIRITSEISGASPEESSDALRLAGWNIRDAVALLEGSRPE